MKSREGRGIGAWRAGLHSNEGDRMRTLRASEQARKRRRIEKRTGIRKVIRVGAAGGGRKGEGVAAPYALQSAKL